MGIIKKSQKIPAEQLDALQQQASSNPAISSRVQALTDAAKAKSIASGRSVGWSELPKQIKSIYQENGIEIPDGYDVDMEGQIVYTNKTPYLQQAMWAASPFVAGGVAGKVAGAVGGAAGGTGGGLSALAGGGGAVSATAVPSSVIGTGLTTAGAGGALGGMYSAPSVISSQGASQGLTSGGGGGFFSKFLGGAKKFLGGKAGDILGRVMDTAGTGLSSAAQAAATNRGVSLEAELEAQRLRQEQEKNYHDLVLRRSVDDRESMDDAFTKSVQANRVFNRQDYKAPMISQWPGQAPTALPTFGFGHKAPTEQERGDAQALYNEVQKRLYGGSQLAPLAAPVPFQNDPKYMNPGAGEKIAGWVAPILKTGGAAFGTQEYMADRRRRRTDNAERGTE